MIRPAWWDLTTAAGRFTLCPVKPGPDLPLLHRWMNDPAVARSWALDGPVERTARYLARQRSLAHTGGYLARLAGRPIGYWEVYRAAEDRLAGHYPARPDDLGVHLLIGEPDRRGLGLATLLLRAFGDAVQRGGCRIVSDPDERDTASVHALRNAGFSVHGTAALAEKRATLLIRDPAPGAAGPAR